MQTCRSAIQFYLEILKRNNSGDLGVNEVRFKMNLKEIGCQTVDRIHLAHKKVLRRNFVATLMNLEVSIRGGVMS